MSLASDLNDLALSLEAAVPLATTRYEHMRVAGHAVRARALAEKALLEDRQASQEPLKPTA